MEKQVQARKKQQQEEIDKRFLALGDESLKKDEKLLRRLAKV